jgi:hypothetical protein
MGLPVALPRRTVLIERHADLAHVAYLRAGFPPSAWPTLLTNYRAFSGAFTGLRMPFCALDDDDAVLEVLHECLGYPGSHELVAQFQMLKVEQHTAKAVARLSSSQVSAQA